MKMYFWTEFKTQPNQIRAPFPISIFVALALFYFLMPFYVLYSGLPQVAHFVFIAGLAIAGWKRESPRGLCKRPELILVLMIAYVIWTVIINIIRLSEEISVEPFAYNLYYGFNTLSAILIFYVIALPDFRCKSYSAPQLLFGVFMLALVVQLFLCTTGLGRAYYNCRSMGSFNNPNQLGYFAVLASAMVALLGKKSKIAHRYIYAGLIIGLMLTLFSVSRAGIVGSVAIVALFMAIYERNLRVWLLLIVAGVAFYATNPLQYFVLSQDRSCEGRVSDAIVPEMAAGVHSHDIDPAKNISSWLSEEKQSADQAQAKFKVEAAQLQEVLKESNALVEKKQQELALAQAALQEQDDLELKRSDDAAAQTSKRHELEMAALKKARDVEIAAQTAETEKLLAEITQIAKEQAQLSEREVQNKVLAEKTDQAAAKANQFLENIKKKLAVIDANSTLSAAMIKEQIAAAEQEAKDTAASAEALKQQKIAEQMQRAAKIQTLKVAQLDKQAALDAKIAEANRQAKDYAAHKQKQLADYTARREQELIVAAQDLDRKKREAAHAYELKKQEIATYLKQKQTEIDAYEKQIAAVAKKSADLEKAVIEASPIACRETTKASESEFMRQARYRQYHHLFTNPISLILGNGDGRNDRFCGLEIHSTLGAVLLYHGIFGLLLVSLMMLRTFIVDWRAALLVLVPTMLYGLTHNGLRNPLLFGLMAAVVALQARITKPDDLSTT